jgi:hypothetical protein
MPCYDKKLEASRSDFYNAQYATRDVDCVLTTGELLLLAKEHNVELSLPVPDEDTPPTPSFASDIPILPDLLSPLGSSSGSYLYSLMLAVARTHTHPLTLESKTIRSADYVEYTLRDSPSGPPVFRGATCYGFRNLQNVVRRIGRAAGVQVGRGAAGRLAGGLRNGAASKAVASGAGAAYDYVEVMACPGGCVGGGGQLRAPERKAANGSSTKDAEGFKRDWAADGASSSGVDQGEDSSNNGTPSAATSEAPWSSRAWTREVERAYWDGGSAPAPELEFDLGHAVLPTPLASLKRRGSSLSDCGPGGKSESEPVDRETHGAEGGTPISSPHPPSSAGGRLVGSSADRGAELERVELEALVERALRELCASALVPAPVGGQRVAAAAAAAGPDSWDGRGMGESVEARRRAFFRTQYRAVESEVVGLGVKW